MNQVPQKLTRDDVMVMKWEAEKLIASKMLPAHIKKAEEAIAIMMMGRELNLMTWQSINGINVIHGRPTVAPQLMIALIERSGFLEDMVIDSQESFCSVTMKRVDRTAHKETFSMKHAQRMGLAGKHNWKAQPETMLKWRAISACARVVFSDVINGLYTPEEMNPDLVLDDQGNVEVVASSYVPQEEKASTATQAIEAEEAKDPKILELPKPEAKKEEPASRTKSEPVPETKKPEKWTDQQRKKIFATLGEKRPSKTEEEKKAYLRKIAQVESCNDILKSQVDKILAKIEELPPEEKRTEKIVRSEMRTTKPAEKLTALKKLEKEQETFLIMKPEDKLNPYQMKLLVDVAMEIKNQKLVDILLKKMDREERVSLDWWKKTVKKHSIDLSPK